MTFDAELAPGMLEGRFAELEVERWDAPLLELPDLELPDREAVRDYLGGKGVPPSRARVAAQSVEAALRVIKRGAPLFAQALSPTRCRRERRRPRAADSC